MTEIEKKALALVNEVMADHNLAPHHKLHPATSPFHDALFRAIEQHEAFKQEVSDAVVNLNRYWERCEPAKEDFYARFDRFIIPKPVDPLVEAMTEAFSGSGAWEPCDTADANALRAAIEKRGGKIVWGEGE